MISSRRAMSRDGASVARRPRAVERALRRALGSARSIDLEHAVDLLAFEAVGHLDLQFGAGRDRLVAGRLQGADMQEGVAGAVCELNKAEALIGLEPFDDCVHRRRRGCRRHIREAARAAARGPEWGALWTVGARSIVGGTIVVEAALARSPKISAFAHEVCPFLRSPGEPPVRTQKGARRPTTPERLSFR